MSAQVLHLDLAALSPATSAEDRRQLIEAAGCLTSLAEVTSAGVIEASPSTGSGRSDEADFELAFFFLLPEFAALEHFGTDPLYARFLRGRLAPLLRSFAGVDVRLEGEFPAMSEHAAMGIISQPPRKTMSSKVMKPPNEHNQYFITDAAKII